MVYSRALLAAQACLWAAAVVPAVVIVAFSLRSNVVGRTAAHGAVFIAACAAALLVMLGLGALSAYLAANLRPGRPGIRQTAVAVEFFMAGLGVLGAYAEASLGAGIVAGIPALTGLIGATLSVTAAIGLLSKAARAFAAASRHAGA